MNEKRLEELVKLMIASVSDLYKKRQVLLIEQKEKFQLNQNLNLDIEYQLGLIDGIMMSLLNIVEDMPKYYQELFDFASCLDPNFFVELENRLKERSN